MSVVHGRNVPAPEIFQMVYAMLAAFFLLIVRVTVVFLHPAVFDHNNARGRNGPFLPPSGVFVI